MFSALSAIITKHSGWIILLGVAFIAASVAFGTGVFNRLESGGFADPNSESYKAFQIINNEFGDTRGQLIVLFSSPDLKVTDPAYRNAALETLDVARKDGRVESVTDYYHTPSPQFVSTDSRSTFAIVQLKGDQEAISKTTSDLRPKITSNRLDVKTGGGAGVNDDFNTIIGQDLSRAETISFSVLAVLLIFAFRSLVAAALPLLLGAFGVLGAFLVVRLLTQVMAVSQYAVNVIILLGLGLAIDYSLFIVSRFREQLRSGASTQTALRITMQTAGHTVFFSGITVMLSLLGLLIFPVNFLKSMGLGGAAAVLVAMTGALTLLPATLVRLGNRVNALSFGRTRQDYKTLKRGEVSAAEARSVWYRVAGWSMRYPLLSIALIVTPLVLIGSLFLQAKFSSADYRSLPAGTQSRVVTEELRQNFPGGGGDPIRIAVETPGNAADPANGALLQSYENQVRHVGGVTNLQTQTKDDLALISVSYNGSYDDQPPRDMVQQIRELPRPPQLQAWVGGATAELVDLLASLGHYAPYAAGLVALALFILLFIMLGSVVVPLQAIFVNILSLSATFGILVWIFQFGHLEKVLGFTSLDSIDATQPVLIFAIAFGLSMDYAVFLLSRIKEEYDQTGQTAEAVRAGVAKTGTIITSAAILLIVVVGAFATSSIPLMKQIGIGLAVAIFLDAFVIRMLLVPALMRLFGRANWWSPFRRRSSVSTAPGSSIIIRL